MSSVVKTIISSVSMMCLIFSGNNKLAAKLMGLNEKPGKSETTSELTSDTESSDQTKKRKKHKKNKKKHKKKKKKKDDE